jgi:hypothetical protein
LRKSACRTGSAHRRRPLNPAWQDLTRYCQSLSVSRLAHLRTAVRHPCRRSGKWGTSIVRRLVMPRQPRPKMQPTLRSAGEVATVDLVGSAVGELDRPAGSQRHFSHAISVRRRGGSHIAELRHCVSSVGGALRLPYAVRPRREMFVDRPLGTSTLDCVDLTPASLAGISPGTASESALPCRPRRPTQSRPYGVRDRPRQDSHRISWSLPIR